MREQEPIKIDKGFHISSKLDSEEDVKKLVRMGIKRVVFFGGMPQMQIAESEETWLKRQGIELFLVPVPDNFFKKVESLRAVRVVLGKIGNPRKKPCLLHCFTGVSSQFFAQAYLISRGHTFEIAQNKVKNALQASHSLFTKFQPEENAALLNLENHYQKLFSKRFRRRGFAAIAGKITARTPKARQPRIFRK